MASVRETLYQFTGDASSLLNELRKVEKAASTLPNEESITIRAEVAKAIADLELVEKKAKEAAEDKELNIHVNTKRLLSDLNKAKRAVGKMPGGEEMQIRIGKIDLREGDVRAAISKIEARIERLKQLKPEVTLSLKIDKLYADAAKVEERLDRLRKQKVTPRVTADIDVAEARLAIIFSSIQALEGSNPRIKVDADIASAEAKLATLLAELEVLEKKKVEIKVDVDRRASANIGAVSTATREMAQTFEKAGAAAAASGRITAGLSSAWSTLSSKLRRIAPIMMGVVIVIVGALVPGLIALGAAAVGAIGGLGALATAFVGTLIPAALGALAVFKRLTAVFDALKAKTALQKQAVTDAANADKQAAQDAQTLLTARRSLGDATRASTRAETALKTARAQARQDIVDAEGKYTEAVKKSKQAADDLASATTDAYRQVRDAIEAAKDAALAFQRSQLNADQSKLNLEKANLALEQFRKESGLAGDSIDALFTKFTDVNVDTSGLEKAISKAAGAASGGGLDKGKQLELQQLILDVRDAKLSEKEATDGVKHAETNLNDTTKVANDLRKTGIKGIDSYRTALDNFTQAQKDAKQAHQDYNKLLQLGVNKAPAVVAAAQAVADAHRNQARAQADLLSTQKKIAGSTLASAGAAATLAEKWNNLSPAEQNFAKAYERLKTAGKDFAKSMAGPVFNGLTSLIGSFKSAAPIIKKHADDLGKAWGDMITSFGQEFHMPKNLFDFKGFGNLKALNTILGGSVKLAKTFGDIAKNTFGLFINIVIGALPQLQIFADDIAGWVRNLRHATSDTKTFRDKLAPAVDALKLLGQIGGGAIASIWDIFQAGSGPINKFLGWIKDAFSNFTKGAKSAKGKNSIKAFFEDTLPAVKSIIKFIVRIVKVFLILFKIVMPILKPIIDMFNSFLDIFIAILKAIDFILGPFKTLIGIGLSFLIPFGRIFSLVGKLFELFRGASPLLGGLSRIFGRFGRELGGPFKAAWDAVVGIFRGVWKRLGTVVRVGIKGVVAIAKAIVGLLKAVFKTEFDLVVNYWKAVFRTFRRVWGWIKGAFSDGVAFLKRIWKPLSKAVKLIASTIEDAFQGAINFVTGIFHGLWRAIKWVLNKIIDGVNILIKGLDKLSFHAPKWVPGIGGKGFSVSIPTIPHLNAGGVLQEAGVFQGHANEAVLPLTRSVFDQLGAAVARNMQPLTGAAGKLQAAPAGAAPVHYDQKFFINSPPATYPDARVTAANLARELRRRGGR